MLSLLYLLMFRPMHVVTYTRARSLTISECDRSNIIAMHDVGLATRACASHIRRHGYGVYEWGYGAAVGECYEGMWDNDRMTGHGNRTYNAPKRRCTDDCLGSVSVSSSSWRYR